MKPLQFSLSTADGTVLQAYKWEAQNPKAVVLIVHGAVEHAGRYQAVAGALARSGYTVYAADLRGHGATAGSPENAAYFCDASGGFSLVVDDIHLLAGRIREQMPGARIFLLGHSMGSLVLRIYAARYGQGLAGVVLTGTGRVNPLTVAAGRLLARCVMTLRGRRHVSPFLHGLVFGTLNRPFQDSGSSCAFICSDKAVVKAYEQDALCGNTSKAEFVYELLWGTGEAASKRTVEAFPKDVPLLIGSGEFDTMGGRRLKAVKQDVSAYRKAGVLDVTFVVYEGMRHEILNEKQNERVYQDVIKWLDAHAQGGQAQEQIAQ